MGLPAKAFDEAEERICAHLVAQVPELAVLPQVVARVLELSNDPSSDCRDYERTISVDPGFAARLLTLANSSYYALPKKITAIKEAVIILGARALRSLALTATGYNLFLGKNDKDSQIRRRLWRHSVNTAVMARALASRLLPSWVDEAFTAGLLHDAGKSIMDAAKPEEYLRSLELQTEMNICSCDAEIEMFGVDHTQVGAKLAEGWRLPAILAAPIQWHHTPELAEQDSALCALVGIADASASLLDSARGCPDEADILEAAANLRFPQSALTILGQSNDQMLQLCAACAARASQDGMLEGWEV